MVLFRYYIITNHRLPILTADNVMREVLKNTKIIKVNASPQI